jgi:hypothetical protein
MVLQMEDCVDVVTVLYPEYDFIFLFDHSCGHDRKRPDGLIQVGTYQSMTFGSSDVGPYWMTSEERELNRADRLTGKKIKRFRNKPDLSKRRLRMY